MASLMLAGNQLTKLIKNVFKNARISAVSPYSQASCNETSAEYLKIILTWTNSQRCLLRDDVMGNKILV